MSTPAHLDIRPIAHLARLALTEAELAEYGSQLEQILGYVAKLETLDVSGVPPTAHPNPVFDVTREDISRDGFGVENALLNAPRRSQDQFGVPKVVE